MREALLDFALSQLTPVRGFSSAEPRRCSAPARAAPRLMLHAGPPARPCGRNDRSFEEHGLSDCAPEFLGPMERN
jgi:hypothetical protein